MLLAKVIFWLLIPICFCGGLWFLLHSVWARSHSLHKDVLLVGQCSENLSFSFLLINNLTLRFFEHFHVSCLWALVFVRLFYESLSWPWKWLLGNVQVFETFLQVFRCHVTWSNIRGWQTLQISLFSLRTLIS